MDQTQEPQASPSSGQDTGAEQQQAAQPAAEAKTAELEQQVAQLKDQLLRKAAEFDNYKRRTEQDFLTFTKYASENVIVQLLPVLDDLQRSLKSVKATAAADDSFTKGIEMIAAKFLKVLQAQGLKPIDALGKEFNVAYHDALLQVPRADVPPHTIIEEVEKGYLLHDKVIRHAKVIVAAEAPNEPDQPVESEVD